MLSRIFLSLSVLGLGLTLISCKTTSESTALRSTAADTNTNVKKNFFDEGFTIKVLPTNTGKAEKKIIAEDGKGNKIAEATAKSESFSLDQATVDSGHIVFTWPKPDEIINRNYKYLEKLMKEYASLVGILLHEQPKGPGEESWLEWIRSDQRAQIEAAREKAAAEQAKLPTPDKTQITKAWCSEAINQLINRLVPEGSQYRQYGNCGEGGIIGACLAKRAGFNENEIRFCLSANDHAFSMVQKGTAPQGAPMWCVLDRWNVIGNFACGLDLDEKRHELTMYGTPMNKKWFQRAGCATLDKYLQDPKSSLYDVVEKL